MGASQVLSELVVTTGSSIAVSAPRGPAPSARRKLDGPAANLRSPAERSNNTKRNVSQSASPARSR